MFARPPTTHGISIGFAGSRAAGCVAKRLECAAFPRFRPAVALPASAIIAKCQNYAPSFGFILAQDLSAGWGGSPRLVVGGGGQTGRRRGRVVAEAAPQVQGQHAKGNDEDLAPDEDHQPSEC